jgi:hypothetical protein
MGDVHLGLADHFGWAVVVAASKDRRVALAAAILAGGRDAAGV